MSTVTLVEHARLSASLDIPTPELPPKPSGIAQLRTSLSRWLSIPPEDEDLIDFCLAVYKSHGIPGDPLWGIIIDASGGGKTELLRAFRPLKNTFFLSKLSERTLVSGYRDPKNPQDPSLLPKLNGKVLIIKDLAPLLSMRRESRNMVIADLRDAYDGFTDQGLGNLGHVGYTSRFTLLAASTLAIERSDAVDQELGERFIKIRARGDGNRKKVEQAICNIGSDDTVRKQIEGTICSFLDAVPAASNMAIPSAMQGELADLADFTARARSCVVRNRGGDIQYVPRPEVGTRLGKELGKLLLSLALVRGKSMPNHDDLLTVRRVAEDCLPPNRLAVITLLRTDDSAPLRLIQDATHLPYSTARRTLEDLEALRLVIKTGTNTTDNKVLWALETKMNRFLIPQRTGYIEFNKASHPDTPPDGAE
jgi:hypothetical protein